MVKLILSCEDITMPQMLQELRVVTGIIRTFVDGSHKTDIGVMADREVLEQLMKTHLVYVSEDENSSGCAIMFDHHTPTSVHATETFAELCRGIGKCNDILKAWVDKAKPDGECNWREILGAEE